MTICVKGFWVHWFVGCARSTCEVLKKGIHNGFFKSILLIAVFDVGDVVLKMISVIPLLILVSVDVDEINDVLLLLLLLLLVLLTLFCQTHSILSLGVTQHITHKMTNLELENVGSNWSSKSCYKKNERKQQTLLHRIIVYFQTPDACNIR